MRPCDARSFPVLDMVFDQEKYKDPYYIGRRKKSDGDRARLRAAAVSVCFCTSVDGSPTWTQGADVL